MAWLPRWLGGRCFHGPSKTYAFRALRKKYHGAGTEAGGSAPAPRHLKVGDLHVVYCAAEMVLFSAALDPHAPPATLRCGGAGAAPSPMPSVSGWLFFSQCTECICLAWPMEAPLASSCASSARAAPTRNHRQNPCARALQFEMSHKTHLRCGLHAPQLPLSRLHCECSFAQISAALRLTLSLATAGPRRAAMAPHLTLAEQDRLRRWQQELKLAGRGRRRSPSLSMA